MSVYEGEAREEGAREASKIFFKLFSAPLVSTANGRLVQCAKTKGSPTVAGFLCCDLSSRCSVIGLVGALEVDVEAAVDVVLGAFDGVADVLNR